MSQDFYLTLSSNASERFYPDNTLTHFFNKLPETIDLRHPRDWEVGLAECWYPYNWFNLQDGEGELELFREVQEEGDAVQVFRQKKKIHAGYYTSPQGFVNKLNRVVTSAGPRFKKNKSNFPTVRCRKKLS
ncbi:hypothetical protein BaRGS_00024549 [Batillaria attramentaria]|uniref:Uncharacterized protein n=1 Tax=Batillaria attramentaria TaxID=370345 RepID=A0ABD0KAM7_9CAEN